MKTIKILTLIAVLAATICSCEKKPPALSTVYGTYNGTLSAGASSMGAYTVITKIDDNYVSFGIGQTGGPVSMVADSISISAATTNYNLSKTEGAETMSGTVDGTTLNWHDSFYTFTGTK